MSKTNSLYNDKNNTYKYLILIYKTFHIVFALHFGFFSLKSFKFKLFLILQCTFYCTLAGKTVLSNELSFFYAMRGLIYIFQYFMCVLLLTCIKNDSTFCYLFHDLRIIDSGLKVNHASYKFESNLLLSIIAAFCFRLSLFLLHCLFLGLCNYSICTLVQYMCIFFALDVILITCSIMFYAMKYRLKVLASLVMAENSDFLSLQHLYKSIVDIAETHKAAISPVFLFSLLFNVPDAMATIYLSVQRIENNRAFSLLLLAHYTHVFEMITLTIMPAICAGTLATQAENIKRILHDKLLQLRVDAQAVEIERFIRYVEARDCQFSVCKVIPLDAHLIGTVLSFCVTYLIVIMQFTDSHKNAQINK